MVFGFLVLAIFCGFTLAALKRFGEDHKKVLTVLFLIVVFTHLAAVAFIHEAKFYPFGTGTRQGDQTLYHVSASAIAQDFRQGDFSLQSIQSHLHEKGYDLESSYSVIVGGLYALTASDQFVGKAFNVWLAALSILLVYLIALEIGASSRGAFVAALIANAYPSYLYFGSLLGKEALVAFLAMLAVFLLVLLTKFFSLKWYAMFFLAVFLLTHFRFYLGLIALAVFVVSFIFFLREGWQKKLAYGAVIIPLLGFIPYVFGYGYYGISSVATNLNPARVVLYREHLFNVPVDQAHTQKPIAEYLKLEEQIVKEGRDPATTPSSTVVVKAGTESPIAFAKNHLTSFLFVSSGPFPWHLTYTRHFFALIETIPWYVLLFFIAQGSWRSRSRWRLIVPIALFSALALAALALLIDNFGIYMRIRIPAFLALLSLASLRFSSFFPHAFKKISK